MYRISTTQICRRMGFTSLCQKRVRRILVFFWPLGKQWEYPSTFIFRWNISIPNAAKCPAPFTESYFLYFHCVFFFFFCLLKDSSDTKVGRTQRFQQSCGFQMNNIGLTIAVHRSEEFQTFCLQTDIFSFLQLIRRHHLQDIKHPPT